MIKDSKTPEHARDVTRQRRRGRRALAYCSRKNGDVEVRVESGLEHMVGMLLEADPRVVSYVAQPFVVELESNAVLANKDAYIKKPGVKSRFYTPDFVCRMDDGSLLVVDAKHDQFLEKFEERREDISQCLRGHGMDFRIIPQSQIDAVVMRNISILNGWRANHLDQYVKAYSEEVCRILETKPIWQADELSQHLSAGKPPSAARYSPGFSRVICANAYFQGLPLYRRHMVISIISKYWRSADMRKFGNGSEVMRGEAKYRVVSYRPHNSQIRLEDLPEKQQLGLHDMSARRGLTPDQIIGVLQCVLDGRLRPTGQLPDLPGLAGLRFDRREVEALLAADVEDAHEPTLLITDVVRMQGWKHESILAWIKAGHLRVVHEQRGQQQVTAIPVSALLDFLSRYLVLADAAERVGSKSNWILRGLMPAGVAAVGGASLPGGGQRGVLLEIDALLHAAQWNKRLPHEVPPCAW